MEELRIKVEQLRKNKQNIPISELKTKYKTAYNELIKIIQMLSTKALKDIVLSGLVVYKNDGMYLVDVFNKIVENERVSGGIMDRASKSLFNEYDVDKFTVCANELRQKFLAEWKLYCKKHCKNL